VGPVDIRENRTNVLRDSYDFIASRANGRISSTKIKVDALSESILARPKAARSRDADDGYRSMLCFQTREAPASHERDV